jgi:hypothetical protein
VPVFDAWEVHLDPSVNFENISGLLPRFEGDISSGSCLAVGHSLTSYVGKKSDKTEDNAQVQLGTNILFAIIFGVPEYLMSLLMFTHNLHQALSFKNVYVKKFKGQSSLSFTLRTVTLMQPFQ